MTAEIVVIVENQDACFEIALTNEIRSGQTADPRTDYERVDLAFDRQPGNIETPSIA
jgi:hypothetical protein